MENDNFLRQSIQTLASKKQQQQRKEIETPIFRTITVFITFLAQDL